MLTVGHGGLDRAAFADLLRGAGVELLVDVRRFPGSRANPDVARGVLPEWLAEAGIDYRWAEHLGGRRRLTAQEDEATQDPWWTVAAFRAYAAHTRTDEFREALEPVLTDRPTTAVMCSESVWWRCHRRLTADVAALGHDVGVQHLMPDGRLTVHPPAAGARLRADGLVVWDSVGPAQPG